jgi:CHAT domain-containing protein
MTPHAADALAEVRNVLLVGDPEKYPDPGDGTALGPLPGSRRELDGIARLVGPERVERLSGTSATEARLRERVHGMNVLHFSTHGVVRDEAPLESFVALSPGAGGAQDDGRLTTEDVYGLELGADLVFLSACRTARGGVSADGVMGLTRAFFHAGASSIVATLSDVVDEPAQRLVSDFYRARQAGEPKVTALRDAQLAMLRDLRAGRVRVDTPAGPVTLPESPALWAPFVLLGEP